MNKSGFSLIEVLVAMVIVSLITTTGMFAFKLAVNQIDRQSSLTFNEAMQFTQLKNLFNGTYFYVKEKKELINMIEIKSYEYVFDKDEKEITFISDAPIYSKHLSLINLKIVEDKLIYKEEAVYSKNQDYKKPVFMEETVEHELLRGMTNAKFSYEKPNDLPKGIDSKIPKLVTLHFRKNKTDFSYIFDIKYNFYHLKKYLTSKGAVE